MQSRNYLTKFRFISTLRLNFPISSRNCDMSFEYVVLIECTHMQRVVFDTLPDKFLLILFQKKRKPPILAFKSSLIQV